MTKARAAASITKPTIDSSAALQFATQEVVTKPKAKSKAHTKAAAVTESAKRVFFAPEGDRRLTINLRQDLHKKLKLLAVEQETTIGEILEQLVERHL